MSILAPLVRALPAIIAQNRELLAQQGVSIQQVQETVQQPKPSGYTGTVSVRNSNNTGSRTLTFTDGVLTAVS